MVWMYNLEELPVQLEAVPRAKPQEDGWQRCLALGIYEVLKVEVVVLRVEYEWYRKHLALDGWLPSELHICLY